tara:strand:+ start:837 stop:1031 length:195 start_codon:yes stop_codon:yes gene_type:complete
MIQHLINLETMQDDDHIMQRITLLSLFKVGVFASQKQGQHFSFSLGIGPAEIEWSFRLWLTKTR